MAPPIGAKMALSFNSKFPLISNTALGPSNIICVFGPNTSVAPSSITSFELLWIINLPGLIGLKNNNEVPLFT